MNAYALPKLHLSIYPVLVAAGWMAFAIPSCIAQASVGGTRDKAFDPCAATAGAKFDVVSIKPSKARSGGWHSDADGDLVSLSGTTKGLIEYAFGLRDFQITGGGDWVSSDTFDITAKFDVPGERTDAVDREAVSDRWKERYMSMLSERFDFRCHITTSQLPVYDLVRAKGDAKLKPTTAGTNEDSLQGHGDAQGMHIAARGVASGDIVMWLVQSLDRTVVDKTGLTDRYDFTLDWSNHRQAERNSQDGVPSLPELPTALEEQLGLKLVPSKGPVPVLVIDHIEKPSAN
jgi:bla regulator protein BlaR1